METGMQRQKLIHCKYDCYVIYALRNAPKVEQGVISYVAFLFVSNVLRLSILRSLRLRVLVLTFASIFLVGFHQIVVIAVEQYQRLEDKTLRLFSSSEGETVSLLTHKFTIRSKWPITAFTQYLESQVRIRKGNLLDVGSSGFSPGAMERLIAAFSDVSSDVSLDVSSDVSSRRLGGECPFCSAESTELIQDLASRALVCSEYISRQQRISKFMRIKDCTHHSQLHINELRGEVDILTNLWKTITVRFIQELSCTFLDISTKLRHFLNGLLKQLGLVVPNLRDFEAHDLHDLYDGKDCFDRLPAHQWLEMLDQDPSNEVWPTISMENINEQDWFGRTVLHISCQKRWHRATRLLLNIGANPGKSTKFSSLPIHYAAANGSKLICGMLLAHQDKFDIHGTDSNGLTAHDYAIRNGCPEVAELLSEYRDIGKEQATPINASANSHS
jgi:hypothetical protein